MHIVYAKTKKMKKKNLNYVHLSQNLHILCAFKSKLAHTLCTFKLKFAHMVCANKACQCKNAYETCFKLKLFSNKSSIATLKECIWCEYLMWSESDVIKAHLLGMLSKPSPLFGISGICSLFSISGYSTALWIHCCCWLFELPECCFANCCCSPATICITSGLPARAVEVSRGRRIRWIRGGILAPVEALRQRILGGPVSSQPCATWSPICTPLPSVSTTLCLVN